MSAHDVGVGATRPPARPGGRRESLAQASARVPFWLKLTAVWLVIFAILGLLFYLSEFDTEWMRENGIFILKGLQFTVLTAILAIAMAIVMALLGALGRLSSNPIAYGVSGFYTSFFRGTPLIVQMFLILFALPQVARNAGAPDWLRTILLLSPFQIGIIALGLNYGAYMTEIFRAGIQSVGHGQGEAADALGMTYRQKMRRVVLPQAFRVIIPPTGNEFIAMMKDTALVGFLGVTVAQAEIFRRATLVGKADFKNLEALVLAAGLYWGLTAIFTYFQGRLEKRIGKGYVRGDDKGGRRTKIVSTSKGGGIGGGAGRPIIIDEDVPPEGLSGGPEIPGQGH